MKPIAHIVLGLVALMVAVPAFAGPSQGWMYWAERNADLIHRTHLDGTGDEILFTSLDGVVTPDGIALDVAGDRVYWTSGEISHKVQRGKLDGTGPVETLITMPDSNDNLTHIALDLVGGKMYFAESVAPGGKIWVANLDGTNLQEFLAMNSVAALAIDPVARKLYWAFIPNLACTGEGKIQRSDLDGRNIEDVITDLQVVRSIAVDSKLDWIYWNEGCPDGIRRAHLDGSGIETWMPAQSSRGIAIDAGSEMVYWTTLTDDAKIRRADLALKQVDDLVTLIQFPYGIALIPGAPAEPADLNGDGIVNGIDLAILLGAWGRCPPVGSCAADLNGSGNVNGLDLAMLLGAWG